MEPRRTRQEIIDLLARAAVQAQSAEAYHAAAADPRAVKGPAAQQAACDAAAMQLIELAGCAEEFIRGRGDPGTTLARFDDALEPVVQMRTAHTHPERVFTPPAITPSRLDGMIRETAKTLTFNYCGETKRRGIFVWDGVEQCKPFGTYSMCAIISADDQDAVEWFPGTEGSHFAGRPL
jgi:hypothetical protein